MSDLGDLDKRIAEKLAARREQAYQHYNHQAERWHEWQNRHQRYTALADHLVQDIIRPLLVKLANHFDNAVLLGGVQTGRHQCVCTFKHTARYPATAKLELAVSRDGLAENVLLLYELSIVPVFFQFAGHDQMTLPIDRLDEAKVAAWFDEKIMCFLDAYLNLETLEQYQIDNQVIDPVCGMRINKLFATEQTHYHGQTYYFCIPECRAIFNSDPEKYLVRGCFSPSPEPAKP
jgi:YHS domain-containing protein